MKQRTADFGKVLAVALMAAPVEFIAPKPQEQTRHEHAKGKRGDGSIGANTIIVYVLKACIPEYPTRKHRKPPMSGSMQGPFASTKRPSMGAEM